MSTNSIDPKTKRAAVGILPISSWVPFGNLEWEKQSGVQIDKTQWRYRLYFEALRLSPSYRLCHDLKTQNKRIPKQDQPVDFEKVRKVYAVAGNVWDVSFSDWFEDVSEELFGIGELASVKRLAYFESAKKADLNTVYEELQTWNKKKISASRDFPLAVFYVPLHRNQADLVRSFTRHLKTLKPKFIKAERKGIVKIQSNKMQLWSLWVGIAITKRVNEREKGIPLWKIGWEFNLRSIQKAFPVLEEKIDPDATQNLGADIWRQTKRINQIAESAARGVFPAAINTVKA